MTTPRRGKHAPLEIHFYCDSVPFTEDTIHLRESLGGSESALIHLARALSARGHSIVVYTSLKELAHYFDPWGVRWFTNKQAIMGAVIRARRPEVFVSLRQSEILNWTTLAECDLRILWNQDLLSQPGLYHSHAWQTDQHVFVSEYQRQQYLREMPAFEERSWVTKNPVDLEQLDAGAVLADGRRDMDKLIHISRPERAMVAGMSSPLLECFSRIRKQRPNVKLHVARYHSMYENNPTVSSVCRRADALMEETDGVEWLGELGKEALYEAIGTSALMLYPGVDTFAETACIAAIETQYLGTPMVATKIGALIETMGDGAGALIEGDSTSEEYQQQFADAALWLLADADSYQMAQEVGHLHAKAYDADVVAADWERWLLETFADRFAARTRGVFDQCMRYDDIRGARLMAAKHFEPGKLMIASHEADANENPDQYAERAVPPQMEYESSPRADIAMDQLMRLYPDHETVELRILDYACGNGAFAAHLLDTFPNALLDAVDYSLPLVEVAREFLKQRCALQTDRALDFTVGQCGDPAELEQGVYDLVFAGEICEHFEQPEAFMAALEKLCKPPTLVVDTDADSATFTGGEAVHELGGRVYITVPCGPFTEMMATARMDWSQHMKGHKFAFGKRFLDEMVGHKPGYDDLHMDVGDTPRGMPAAHFMSTWTRDDTTMVNAPDMERRVRRLRPMDRLAVCMIVKDAENDLARCLKSVERISDEIWVADTGSTDGTMRIAEPFVRNGGAVWSIGVCPEAEGMPPPGDFSWARNHSISMTDAEWILWIDADEILEHPALVTRYLTDNVFNGYVLRQCHVMKDAPFRWDRPVRLYRREMVGKHTGNVPQFFGAIHEHAQVGLNTLIDPTLMIEGGDIIHTGYLREGGRRVKAQGRNLPLLVRDREQNPTRILGRLLEAREACNLARWEVEARTNRGEASKMVREYRPHLYAGLRTIREHFYKPDSLYWEPAFEVYGDILALLGEGQELPVAEMQEGGTFKNTTYRFADADDYAVFLADVARKVKAFGEFPDILWDGWDVGEWRKPEKVEPVGAPPVEDMPELPTTNTFEVPAPPMLSGLGGEAD